MTPLLACRHCPHPIGTHDYRYDAPGRGHYWTLPTPWQITKRLLGRGIRR